MKLHETLLKKAAARELGHFYVIETSAPEEQSTKALITFVQDFIRDYYQKIEGHKQSLTHLMDHPDVYVLGNTLTSEEDENSEKNFTVLDSEAFSRFFEFRPVQSKRKFAVITEGHRITDIVANKWLKLFEEPNGESTIFLLNPRRQKLLPTIMSRAIHLRLSVPREATDLSEWHRLMTDLKQMTLSQFLDQYRKGPPLSFWVGELIRWESEQFDHPESKFRLEKWLKSYQEMETFHQPAATKWTLLHSYLITNVLSRQNH